MLFRDKLKGLKIDAVTETRDDFSRNNVIGFRGIRENIGATTVASHIAVELEGRGFSVCYVDLDFQNPNHFFSQERNYTVLDKLNNQSMNVMNIVNKTKYRNLSYIGARPQEPITTYMPLLIDDKYVEEKRVMFQNLFDDLQSKFEVVIVDIPSDLRLIESVIAVQNCKMVITLCQYDIVNTTKLIKDNILLSDIVDYEKIFSIVNVNTPFSFKASYATIDSRIKTVAQLYQSKVVYDDCSEKRLERNRKGTNKLTGARDLNEDYYFKGITSIIEFMKGGEIDVSEAVVPAEDTSSNVLNEPDVQGDT